MYNMYSLNGLVWWYVAGLIPSPIMCQSTTISVVLTFTDMNYYNYTLKEYVTVSNQLY